MSDLGQILLYSYHNGTFFETLVREATSHIHATQSVADALLDIHNSGQLDVLAAYTELQISQEDRSAFTLVHLLSKIMGKVESSPKIVMDCIRSLEQNQHQVFMLVSPFLEFCGKSEARCDYVLENMLAGYESNFDFLMGALVAGSKLNLKKYLDVATGSELMSKPLFTEKAISSIGRMNFQGDDDLIDAAFNYIETVSQDSSKALLNTSLAALHSLYLQDKTREEDFLRFIGFCSASLDASLVLAASEILFFENGKSGLRIEDALLELGCNVSMDSLGAINHLDYALEKIMTRGEFDKSVTNLERILENNNYQIGIGHFNSLTNLIIENKDTYLEKLITRWLLSGNAAKGRMCFDLLQHAPTSGMELSFDLPQLSGDYSFHHLFLAEKSCGWFFTLPLTAMSLIVSLVDTAADAQLESMKQIAINPLSITYPGSIGRYLNSIKNQSNDKLKLFCESILGSLEKYHADLKPALGIKELKPSEEERYRSAKHIQNINEKAMKKAEAGSLISLLGVHKSILLYGRKSISYMDTGSEKIRQEMPLHLYSTSVEYPSLQYIDPHNLDYHLLSLRLKGFEN
ncbi:MAG: hypothetical protein K0Q74_1595 [Gammaproteobacteria bacterium]|jgi:hypothetical protein|nr:hypothetical protein [Gammaproteobacteria bacterium]